MKVIPGMNTAILPRYIELPVPESMSIMIPRSVETLKYHLREHKPIFHVFIVFPNDKMKENSWKFGCAAVKLSYLLDLCPHEYADVVIISFEEERDAALDVLRTCAASQGGNMTIVYDQTNTYPALLPSDAFELVEIPYAHGIAERLMYTGKLPEKKMGEVQPVLEAWEAHKAMESLSSVPGVGNAVPPEEILELFKAYTLDKIPLDSIYPKSWNGKADYRVLLHYENLFDRGLLKFGINEYPIGVNLDEDMKAFIALSSELEYVVEDVSKLWKMAFRGTTFDNSTWVDASENPIDFDKMMAIGKLIGMDGILDAYLAGVPVCDLLGKGENYG